MVIKLDADEASPRVGSEPDFAAFQAAKFFINSAISAKEIFTSTHYLGAHIEFIDRELLADFAAERPKFCSRGHRPR